MSTYQTWRNSQPDVPFAAPVVVSFVTLLIGGAISAIFLLSNFHAHLTDCFPYGEGDAKRKMYLLLGSMTAFHVVLLALFKIYFFEI